MLDMVLQILSVIGIILLVLLIILLVALLLVLFFPVTYKLYGKKNGKDIQAWVKANWLFGLLRVRFFYPEPGKLTVKLLGFTLYDSAKTNDSPTQEHTESEKKTQQQEPPSETKQELSTENESDQNADTQHMPSQTASEILENVEGIHTIPTTDDTVEQEKKSIKERILEKYEKIKYTIRKIYDKIKHILENITFYKTLLQDEQTKGLLHHAFSRFGRILKSIRPRKLKGDILFGTGSPDTTGYAFGIYGMFIPMYGKYMNVTPDFTRAVLEGELYAAGHITVFQLLRHGVMLLLDKRLRLLIHRIKTHTI